MRLDSSRTTATRLLEGPDVAGAAAPNPYGNGPRPPVGDWLGENRVPSRWNYLVSETLFASDLVESGVRRLCTVPIRDDDWPVGHDQKYTLYVGLHSYASGLERLCKLTIACHGFLATGDFSSMRKYGHKIRNLLDAVERLDLGIVLQDVKAVPARPVDSLDPKLTVALERFANGAGRYEHLDSLWDDKADVATLNTWTELCGRVTPSARVRDLIGLRNIVVERLRLLSTHAHLESSAYAFLESLDPYISELSTAVALKLYEKARWVALILDALTYYTHPDLPLLGEAVENIRPPAQAFFQYSVARIEDEDAANEDLESHFEQFGHLGEDEDD